MGNVNYGRLIAGAVVAAVFYFLCDGFIHGAMLGRYHMEAIAHAGYPLTADNTAFVYFGLFDLGKGLVTMLIYVAARVPCKPGPKTAVVAGLIAWLAIEVLPSISWMPFWARPSRFRQLTGKRRSKWIREHKAAACCA